MPAAHHKRLLASALITGVTAATLAATPAQAASTYTYESTINAGSNADTVLVDSAKSRAYVYNKYLGNGAANGEITWVNTDTKTQDVTKHSTGATEPLEMQFNRNKTVIYTIHNKSQVLSVTNLQTGHSSQITGMPRFPKGLEVDTDKDLVYVWDSKNLHIVDPQQGAIVKTLTLVKETQVQDLVYDSARKLMWASAYRTESLRAINTETQEFLPDVEIAVNKLEFNGTPVGGNLKNMVLDPQLNLLHMQLDSEFGGTWENNRIVSFNVDTRKFVGDNYIEVGVDVRQLAVNPVTHEVYTTNHKDNTVSVINPETWQASTLVDFNAQGVTSGTGSAEANTSGIAVSADGNTLYVTHPYKANSRMSFITRSGSAPKPSVRPDTPGQGGGAPSGPAAWNGPAAVVPSAAAGCAVPQGYAELNWGITDYADDWAKVEPLGNSVTKDAASKEFTWAGGNGWYDPVTGGAELSWAGGVFIEHYPGLKVETTFGNPLFTRNADGSAVITTDLFWQADTKQAAAYTRVPIMTFQTTTVEDIAGIAVITGTPDWEGRSYVGANGKTGDAAFPKEFIDALHESMQPWWYRTGASGDVKKTPKPVTIAIPATVSACPAAQDLQLTVDTAMIGDELTATAKGFMADQEVTFTLHSTSVIVGAVNADANGIATLTFKIPAGVAPGAHTLKATQVNGLLGQAKLTVQAAPAAPVKPGSGSGGTGAGSTANSNATGNSSAGVLAKGGAEQTVSGLLVAVLLGAAAAVYAAGYLRKQTAK